eukprot:TRINITY_DN40000_c0_g1_i1.p1 TRINITY_DN40000_c0_g1~~TRINITY_DN40000_c0_g1_i1.p1  ORF type:complete len:341 (+),score=51.91 TRINITY_DN40000_c0_g1_i1:85-1023(+)
MERRRRLLLNVQEAANAVGQSSADEAAMQRLRRGQEALIRDASRMSCSMCAEELSSQHRALSRVTDAAQLGIEFEAIRRGAKQMMACSELRYTKGVIGSTFKNGEPINNLRDKLICDDTRADVLRALCLFAVRYHGEVFVVEGNRRLKALNDAETVIRPEQTLEVQVEVVDLYLGRIYGRPALRVFWEALSTKDEGKTVEVIEQLDERDDETHPGCEVPSANLGSSSAHQRDEPSGAASLPQQEPQQSVQADSQRIDFGKHMGKSYEEVLRLDPSYCAWVLSKRRRSSCPGLRAFADFLASRGDLVRHDARH